MIIKFCIIIFCALIQLSAIFKSKNHKNRNTCDKRIKNSSGTLDDSQEGHLKDGDDDSEAQEGEEGEDMQVDKWASTSISNR